jgi:hypothetical protein
MTELGPVRAAEIAEYDGIGEIVDGLLRKGVQKSENGI